MPQNARICTAAFQPERVDRIAKESSPLRLLVLGMGTWLYDRLFILVENTLKEPPEHRFGSS
jgi:hypothetical protein